MVNQSVEVLELPQNNLGFKGIQAMAKMLRVNTALSELKLQRCRIDQFSAPVLAKALAENEGLRLVDVSMNEMGEGILSFSETLRRNKTMVVLNVAANLHTERHISELLLALRENSTLRSFHCFATGKISSGKVWKAAAVVMHS